MLRFFFLLAAAVMAVDCARADDLEVCRDRKAETKPRQEACERILAAGQASDKDKGIAYGLRGNVLLESRSYDKAIVALDAAIAADPNPLEYLVWRGLAYARKGDEERAMADYNAVLQVRPNQPYARNNRGVLYLRKGALQSALDDFNAALTTLPGYVLARVNRARVLIANRDFDGALADLAEAQRLDPKSHSESQRCIAYKAMGKYNEAIAECNIVIERLPKNQFVLTSRADVYLAKGEIDKALKDYNFVLNLNPNAVRAHAGRGQLFEKRRDLAQARADYRAASIALTPFDDFEVGVARNLARERLAVLTSQTAGAGGGRRVALIIGNGAYNNVARLDNPPRDAALVADALRDVGFQTVTLSKDLGRDKFFEVLHGFAREAEKADWAVGYYAGHGFEIGGVNYLVPVDARLAVDSDAETQMVALEQVIAAVGAARKLRLVILDACRDNPFEKNMRRTIALKLVDKGFSNIEPGAGFMVVYGAKHGETALDGEGANSPFAIALAREIRVPKVEVRKMFDIVRDDVWTVSKHQQQPFTYGSPPGREDFYFVAGK